MEVCDKRLNLLLSTTISCMCQIEAPTDQKQTTEMHKNDSSSKSVSVISSSFLQMSFDFLAKFQFHPDFCQKNLVWKTDHSKTRKNQKYELKSSYLEWQLIFCLLICPHIHWRQTTDVCAAWNSSMYSSNVQDLFSNYARIFVSTGYLSDAIHSVRC